MMSPDNVFVADARAALAVPARRSAYVFGAAHPLGEALLAQILASSAYSRVYISTTAVLPASVAHLYGVLSTQPFTLQDDNGLIDCVLIVDETLDALQAANIKATDFSASARTRSSVYAPLLVADVPAVLRQIAVHCGEKNASWRCLLAAPNTPVDVVSSWVFSYSRYMACMVYGLHASQHQASSKAAYQFKPEGSGVLDRFGVWILNFLSSTVHSMMSPQQTAVLSSVKTAQRLADRFSKWDCALPSPTSPTLPTPPLPTLLVTVSARDLLTD